MMMSVRPSVCPYPPFHSGSYRPIFKIIFLFERYDMRDLTFILFVRLSVRLSVRPSVHTRFKFRSYRPIFKILFLFERYDIRVLTLIIFVRLSVHLSIRPFRTPLSISVLTVRFPKFFFCLKDITSETFLYTFYPPVRTPFYLPF